MERLRHKEAQCVPRSRVGSRFSIWSFQQCQGWGGLLRCHCPPLFSVPTSAEAYIPKLLLPTGEDAWQLPAASGYWSCFSEVSLEKGYTPRWCNGRVGGWWCRGVTVGVGQQSSLTVCSTANFTFPNLSSSTQGSLTILAPRSRAFYMGDHIGREVRAGGSQRCSTGLLL